LLDSKWEEFDVPKPYGKEKLKKRKEEVGRARRRFK
jgi:hypothetical protein